MSGTMTSVANSALPALASSGGKGGASLRMTNPETNTFYGPQSPAPAPAPAIKYTAPTGSNVFNQASQGLTTAMQGTAQGMSYQPQMVGGFGYAPSTLSGTNLAQYGNPFEQDVISGLQSDAAKGMQMGSNQLGAQATAAKAFGGSRHGIAEGQMMGDVQNQLNNQIGQMRQSEFRNAQQMALADAAARNQASQFGIGNVMQAQLANQQAGLAGAQQRLGASNQMGNLSNLGFGMGQQINQQQMQQGAMQQALQQMALDKASQQYQGFQQSPYASLQAYTAALGGTPYSQSTTQTQSGSQSRGLFDYLGMGLYGAGALGYRPFA